MTLPIAVEIQLVAVVVAASCAIPGVFLVLRRMALMSDAISHTVLLGILLAFFATGDVASPLLLFAAAASRVPLSTIGLLQFLTPFLQLGAGLLLGETMPASRWFGFALVWVALVVLSVDMLRQVRRSRRARLRSDREDPAP